MSTAASPATTPNANHIDLPSSPSSPATTFTPPETVKHEGTLLLQNNHNNKKRSLAATVQGKFAAAAQQKDKEKGPLTTYSRENTVSPAPSSTHVNGSSDQLHLDKRTPAKSYSFDTEEVRNKQENQNSGNDVPCLRNKKLLAVNSGSANRNSWQENNHNDHSGDSNLYPEQHQSSLRKASSCSTPNISKAVEVDSYDNHENNHHRILRPVSRNHSLKYSGGALHGESNPMPFDHTFKPTKESDLNQNVEAVPNSRVKPPLSQPHQSPATVRQAKMRRRLLKGGGAYGIDSSDSDSTPRRSQSVRLPPVVRLQNEEMMSSGGAPPGGSPKSQRRGSYQSQSTPVSRSSSSNHLQVHNSSGVSTPQYDGSASEVDDDEDDYGSDDDRVITGSIYCTPPHHRSHMEGIDRNEASKKELIRVRKESLSGKSRSMLSLNPNKDKNKDEEIDFGQYTMPVLMSIARSRSYLLGSVGPNALLGAQELERYFPQRNVRVFVGTWNMNGQTPPRHLADFLLPQHIDYVPDILVVGTQETFPEKTEWEIRLQDTLGPSHVLFHSHSLGTLHLTVFLRRDLIWFCSVPEDDAFNTRPGAQFKTKGAVAIAFLLFGTSFLFVNSHLTAHQENVKDRVKDLKKINAVLNLPKNLPVGRRKHHSPIDRFDCVFWCGDLNFRLEQSREIVIREVKGSQNNINASGTSVLDFDQLNYLRSQGLIFKGFQESPILFQPTFKYDPGTNKFDTSHKQRTPSYTDRILFKCIQGTQVNPLYYDSVQNVTTSDHKPVWGMWEVKIRPGKDNIPLAGGLFNREVYLEGLKRRSEALQPTVGKNGSSTCSIQ